MESDPIINSAKSPLTGTTNITLLREIKAEYLIDQWKVHYDIDIKSELKGHTKIYLYQCNETKLKFFHPPNIAGSSKLYEELQKLPWYYMENKWEYHEALKNLNRSDKVLELGCGTGAFLKLGMEVGLDIIGAEFNETALINAKKKGYNVVAADLNKLTDLYFESMNAVCSFQVLEHVNNPKDFIQMSIDLLRKQGKLIICTPNNESYIKYHTGLLLNIPPHHMLHWSKESFIELQKLFPIKLQKVSFDYLADYHIDNYIHTYDLLFKKHPIISLLTNRIVKIFTKKLLNTGLRKLIKGQNIYVQYIKI